MIATFTGSVLTLTGFLMVITVAGIGDQAGGKALSQTLKERGLPREQVARIIQDVHYYTNRERAREGMEPLLPSSALSFLAQHHSAHMCRAGELRHESKAFPKGWQKFLERLRIVGLGEGGENVAFRSISSNPEQWAKAVVEDWMKSPRHRKNILRSEFRYLGVGVEPCENKIAYVTQVFSPVGGYEPH